MTMSEKVQTICLIGGAGESSNNESDFGQSGEVIVDLNSSASIMNSSQISTASTESTKTLAGLSHTAGSKACRFPKLEECAHFHYERVQLGAIVVRLVDEKTDPGSQSISNSSDLKSAINPAQFWFILRVSARRSDPFLIKRSLENLKLLDEMLHRCVYDRKVSGLRDLASVETQFTVSKNGEVRNDNSDNYDGLVYNCWVEVEEELMKVVSSYFNQFSAIASDSMTCGPVLTWLQLDNKGRRLPVADMNTMTTINTPAVGAAYGVRKYVAQACDEISIEVGDMISVIDMPSPAESVWWRGKKSHLQKSQYEVGFFPQSCVATIGEKIPRHMPLPAPLVGSLALSPTKPVLRKHGKLIAFFRSFILSRPSRRRLKQSGIYKERVFSCDLSEHLLNSGQEIPMVLKCCAEFIEQYGIVDGIYRLSGITSNIQKLRRAFDEERIPDLSQSEIKQDIHAVSSLLKMYFRELPNPLCTYQLYDRFVDAIQTRAEGDEKLKVMKETVQKLPPPHYRTLKYLASHLHKISKHAPSTGMTDRNLAIVWAPNLLRSPALESGGVAALRGVGVQAVVTEFLITYSESIFDEDFIQLSEFGSLQQESMTDSESLILEQRDLHDSLSVIERPKSLNVGGGTKLISLEEAQSRQGRPENIDKAIAINTPQCTSYIEVGGGPSSLPDKYHTVLPVPRSWQKRKTHSWKSLFSRAPRSSNSNASMTAKDIKVILKPSDKPEKMDKLKGKENKIQRKDIVHMTDVDKSPMAKSVDVFDTKSITMEVCVRSSSVDSLRTTGHSRSVSHDSYFDLLQSPLRGIVNCPSRELSELGMNFDREEPEMRLFSESESLVSSPRMAKELAMITGMTETGNNCANRRGYRARPDEFSNHGNSINPSPKKQPRLNLQATNDNQNWTSGPMSLDESLCKRYKLEDQLSDIQFIDCNTPEHQINSSTSSLSTSFTTTKFNINAQVHNPPAESDKDINSSNETIVDEPTTVNKNPLNRFSYPQYLGISSLATTSQNKTEKGDRFSYPVTNSTASDNSRFANKQARDEFKTRRYGFQEKETDLPKEEETSLVKSVLDHFNLTDSINQKETQNNLLTVSNQSLQTIVTPSSPSHSPRYSLLTGAGDTSSENYSENGSVSNLTNASINCLNMMEASITSATKLLDSADKRFSCQEEHLTEPNNEGDEIKVGELEKSFNDISALKRKFSLDLDTPKKMSIDLDTIPIVVSEEGREPPIHIPSTPNTPNNTQTSDGNTSQSMTPSEFGYQYLNKNSNACSPTTPHLNQEMSQMFPSVLGVKPVKSPISSPIKSTISIIYKSPATSPVREEISRFEQDLNSRDYEEIEIDKSKERHENIEKQSDKPLETSFDESMVYEQVKFFKSAVSEINQFLDKPNNDTGNQVVPDLIDEKMDMMMDHDKTTPPNGQRSSPVDQKRRLTDNKSPDDVTMRSIQGDVIDLPDSLEYDNNISLYENVIVEKPPVLYENVEVDRSSIPPNSLTFQIMKTSQEPEGNDNENEGKKPGNFLVKQLATRFETSPVDSMPSFDFFKSSSNQSSSYLRRDPSATRIDSGNHSLITISATNTNKIQTKVTSPKINAKSLDENAFVKEFGGTKLIERFSLDSNRVPAHDLEVENNQNNENISSNNRRLSLEYAKPKSLNPPKKLPNLNNNPDICKPLNQMQTKTEPSVMKTEDHSEESKALFLTTKNVYEKITPTIENRISLIQNNFAQSNDDDKDSVHSNQSSSSNIVLGSCKLDRDRIEKIKEERRHQLNEKFRSESFKGEKEYNRLKSKSKIELREKDKYPPDVDNNLRLRSKSKADIYSGSTKVEPVSSGTGVRIGKLSNRSEEQLFPNQNISDKKATVLQDRIRRTSENGDINSETNQLKIHFEKKNLNSKERDSLEPVLSRNLEQTREGCSPQFSIKDVAAIFESRSQT